MPPGNTTDSQGLVRNENSKRIFLSYARKDDEPFVRRLYDDLTSAGFTVWFDRDSLMARGLPFRQEVKDAIRAEVDRVIYVGGPNAVKSPNVREEWEIALLFDHVVVTPILRLGNRDNIPGELSQLQCEDFRDDTNYAPTLAKLIASLRLPNPKLGALFAVPNLPPHFLARPELMQRVRDALLVDLQKAQVITSTDAKVGMQGMGGIGKSVLAAALARNRQIRESYPDGIVWISFGQHLNDSDLLSRQRDLAKHLGGEINFDSLPQGKAALRELLHVKSVLLVLDDVWRAADALAFDELGPRCRMLVTTRDAGILHALNGDLVPVSLFTEPEALQLLADAVGVEVSALPSEAREVVDECGLLPLALALSGGMAKAGYSWQEILEALREADLEWAENREGVNEQHRTIWNAMKVSYDALPDEQKRRFAELVVFATDSKVPVAAVHVLWNHTGQLTDRNCTKLLINLAERSLIQLDQETDADGKLQRHFTLHDLLHDFATKIAGDPVGLHNQWLNAYRNFCPNGWSEGPNDGYFFQNLGHHLIASGKRDELVNLLLDLKWLLVKTDKDLVYDLLLDYDKALLVLSAGQQQRCAIELLQSGLRLSANAISKDKNQLTGQLIGRMLNFEEPEIKQVIREAMAWRGTPWLMSITEALDRPGGAHLRTLEGHSNQVNGVSVTPDGRYAVSASGDRTIRMWDLERGVCIRVMQGHSSFVNCVSITPDGMRAVSSSFDCTLRVWDLESGVCLRTLEGHTSDVKCVSVMPDGFRAVSASLDRTLRIWDLDSGQCLRTLNGHNKELNCVSVTPDGRYAVSASWDHTIQVWDLESGECLRILKGHVASVTSVYVMSDGNRVISTSFDGTLRVFNLHSGECLQTLGKEDCVITGVSVTPDGHHAVSSSWDHTLRVWNLENGECLQTFEGHSGWVLGVRVTPDGRHVISASFDRTLRLWNLDVRASPRTFGGHSACVAGVCIIHSQQRLVTASYDGTLRVWALGTGVCLDTLELANGRVQSVSVTPDGRIAVSVGSDGSLRVWTLGNRKCLRTLDTQTETNHSVTVTPDGRHAVTASWHHALHVWNLKLGEFSHLLEGHEDSVNDVTVTADGRYAISASDDHTLRVWNLESGECLRILRGHDKWVTAVSVTADGHWAVSASYDRTLRVWNLETGATILILTGHTDTIHAVSVSPDGRRAVSVSDDRTLRVWDLESGQCLAIFSSDESLRSCAIAVDTQSYIAGGQSGRVHFLSLVLPTDSVKTPL
jgi:WD40 repeat protein